MAKLLPCFMMGLVAALGGCCITGGGGGTQPPLPLPAPISLVDQVQQLNDRAAALPRLRIAGTIVLRYLDDDGKPKQDSVEGFMLVRQRYGNEAANDPADAYVRGSLLGDVRFYAAKNQDKWWFVQKNSDNSQTGWMGDVDGAADFSGSHSGGIMRADLVLQVLAITEIQPHAGETIAMKVHDGNRTNELSILRLRSNGTAWVKREIIISRDNGNVTQVNLGDPSGRLAVRADLKNYQPVTPSADAPSSAAASFPRDITIDYKAKHLNIHFTVDKAEVVTSVRESIFETPNFAEEGIKNGDDKKP